MDESSEESDSSRAWTLATYWLRWHCTRPRRGRAMRRQVGVTLRTTCTRRRAGESAQRRQRSGHTGFHAGNSHGVAEHERLDWLAGVYFQHRENTYSRTSRRRVSTRRPITPPPISATPTTCMFSTSISRSMRLQATARLAGARPIAGACRWAPAGSSSTERSTKRLMATGTVARPTARATRQRRMCRRGISIAYTPTDDSTVYAVISNGYRPGGPNLPPWSAGDCEADLAQLAMTPCLSSSRRMSCGTTRSAQGRHF